MTEEQNYIKWADDLLIDYANLNKEIDDLINKCSNKDNCKYITTTLPKALLFQLFRVYLYSFDKYEIKSDIAMNIVTRDINNFMVMMYEMLQKRNEA
jgi:hypothetical protein